MKIWIDTDNTPQVPFFCPIIAELERRSHSVVLTARSASQVCELADFFGLSIGRHYGGAHRLLMVLGSARRSAQMARFSLLEKPSPGLWRGSRS
jgi:predicted glycosyltransferase